MRTEYRKRGFDQSRAYGLRWLLARNSERDSLPRARVPGRLAGSHGRVFECGCDFYPSQQHQRTCDDCARDNNMTCPNCGREGDPDESVTAGIRYFNCPTCDFSTWDQAEYLWSVNH